MKRIDEEIAMVQMNDKALQAKLLEKLEKLRQKVDWIAEREIRQAVDKHLTKAYILLKGGVEELYEKED